MATFSLSDLPLNPETHDTPESLAAVERALAMKDRIYTKMIIVTPPLALEWLLQSLRAGYINRKVNMRQVEIYMNDLYKGKWDITNQCIGFDTEGNAIDAQHRLIACILSGCSMPTLAVYGLPSSARKKVDTGKNRTGSDWLRMLGEKDNTDTLSSATKWQKLEDSGKLFGPHPSHWMSVESRHSPTLDDREEALNAHPTLRDGAMWADSVTKTKVPVAPAMLAWVYAKLTDLNPDHAEWFFDRLTNGVGLQAEEPIYVLREKIKSARHYKVKALKVAAWIIKTWNYTLEGNVKHSGLGWGAKEAFPTARQTPVVRKNRSKTPKEIPSDTAFAAY